LQEIVPIFQLQVKEWIVFFIDTCTSNQVSVLISSKTKLAADNIKKSGETFAKHAHDAFVHGGYTSPFSRMEQISVATVFIKSNPRALASMVYLERYNGYESTLPPASVFRLNTTCMFPTSYCKKKKNCA
jgi:hypothetical protein